MLSIAQNKLRGDHRNYSICPPNMRRGSGQDKRGPGRRGALTVSPMLHDDFKKCSCSLSLFLELPCQFEMIPSHMSILKSNTYVMSFYHTAARGGYRGGGPPHFIKREKMLSVCMRMARVLVLNSYANRPPPPQLSKILYPPLCHESILRNGHCAMSNSLGLRAPGRG